MSDTEKEIRRYLADEFGMEEAEIEEMFEMFLETLERLTAEIEESISAGDAGQLKSTGHSLKGVAANIGAADIAAIGKSIEDAGTAGEPAKAAEQLEKLKTALTSLKQDS